MILENYAYHSPIGPCTFSQFPGAPQKKIDAPSTHRLYELGRGAEGRVVLNDATNGANFPFFAATNASSLLPLIRDFYAFLILMVDLPSVKGILIKFRACRVRTGLGVRVHLHGKN